MPKEDERSSSVNFVVYHGWTTSRHYLREISDENHTARFVNRANRPIGHWPNAHSEGGGRFYVENFMSALDAENEFFSDGRTIYLLKPSSADLTNTTAFASVVQKLVSVVNSSAISFERIQFRHADWSCGVGQICDMQSSAWQTSAVVHLLNSRSVRFDRCTIANVGDYALWVDSGCRDISIVSSTLHDLGTGGIRIGVNSHNSPGASACNLLPTSSALACKVTKETAVVGVEIFNCSIHDGGLVFPSGTPVLVQQAQRANISHNDIGSFPYAAISLGWNWNYCLQAFSGGHSVTDNRMHDFGSLRPGALADAMACVYTLGNQSGTYVGRNLCTDVYAFYTGGFCLSQDQGSSDITFDSNVCLRTTGSPQNQHYGQHNRYVNNIFAMGFHDSWVADCSHGCAAGMRASPGKQADPVYTNASVDGIPNSLSFERNLVLHSNATGLLFEGNWNDSVPQWRHSFAGNIYASTAIELGDPTNQVFGGCSERSCRAQAFQLSWAEWQAGGMDERGSVIAMIDAKAGVFADPDWQQTLDFKLKTDGAIGRAVARSGFQPIDTSRMGLVGARPTPPPSPVPTPPLMPTPPPPTPTPTPPPTLPPHMIFPGQYLRRSGGAGASGAGIGYLLSQSGGYRMMLQKDSNLCIHPVTTIVTNTSQVPQPPPPLRRMCTMTNGTSATRAVLQNDGNFCILSGSGDSAANTDSEQLVSASVSVSVSVWCSGTAGLLKPGAGILQDDGRFCLVNEHANTNSTVWCMGMVPKEQMARTD
jgi:hypothetical protein